MSWSKLDLKEIDLKVKFKGIQYVVNCYQIRLSELENLLTKAPVILSVNHADITSSLITISDLQGKTQIFFEHLKYQYSQTDFLADEVKYGQYVMGHIKGNLYNNNKLIFLKSVTGDLYGGDFYAQGSIQYVAPISYNLELKLKKVSSFLLAQVNANFSQLTAVVDGHVKVKSHERSGLLIEADLYAPSGGSMKASLLKFLAQYIPQKQQIESLIEHNEQIILEKAQFKLLSISYNDLSSEVILTSPSINLNMNVKFDIHMDGSLESLLKSLPTGS